MLQPYIMRTRTDKKQQSHIFFIKLCAGYLVLVTVAYYLQHKKEIKIIAIDHDDDQSIMGFEGNSVSRNLPSLSLADFPALFF